MTFNCNIDDYDATQAMIDINTLHLNGLRTECVITENITQTEIRSVESKLIKLFGRQMVERQIALMNGNINVPSPQIRKWLYIVGLNEDVIESIAKLMDDSFEKLLNLNEEQLNDLMTCQNVPTDERRRLSRAMSNLKLFIDKLKVNDPTVNDLHLHWESWDQIKFAKLQQESNYNNKDSMHNNDSNENRSVCPSPLNDSSLIINSREQLNGESINLVNEDNSKDVFKSSSSTPSFQKNNLIDTSSNNNSPSQLEHQKLKNSYFDNNHNTSIPKSKSHEGHLTDKINHNNLSYNRPRLVSEPSGDTKSHGLQNSRSPPISSPDNLLYNVQLNNCFDEPSSFSQQSLANSSSNVNAPRSPRTQGMLHAIHHRFSNRIWPKTVICNLCEKQMLFGCKCKECKYLCHRECASKVPPLCGLPPKYFEIFKATINNRTPISSNSNNNANSTQSSWNQPNDKHNKKINDKLTSHNTHKRSSPDSSSNTSSRNSSAPPSPAQLLNNAINNATGSTFIFNNADKNSSSSHLSGANQKKSGLLKEKFDKNINNESSSFNRHQEEEEENNFDSLDESNRSEVVRLNSQDSQTENDLETSDREWPRQNSMTFREWNIPFNELVREKEIGTGRFGTVFKGKWHGHVAIKMFNVTNGLDNSKALEAFKSEVATFRKTRHENLVLFMGTCIAPPHLAIVTSYCNGEPLFEHLYERKGKFPLARIISIGSQISLGMGYLHARGIVHKDLRSKNVFVDCSNGKVTIADFGFFSLTKLCFSHDKYKDYIKIPKGWLCYLAPELMRSLKPGSNPEEDDLPFSFSTDVFSFGTILHEMIFRFLPFDGQPAEVAIWQVSKGIKQSFINLQASKEIKDILMICWSYKPSERPEFSKISEYLLNLPKKRLQRSPSHPIQLMTKNAY